MLDVADKKIIAPFYITEYSVIDHVSDHQSGYFAALSKRDMGAAKNDLSQFGYGLRESLRTKPLDWKGLGILKRSGSGIVFNAEEIKLESLGNIDAQKVLRENAEHTVLVGETERSSTEMAATMQLEPAVQKSYLNLWGWILLGLSILFIGYLLNRGSFSPEASGLKQTSYHNMSSSVAV